MKKIILTVLLFAISTLSGHINAATQDTGNINRLFVDGGGSVGITLNSGYPNSKNAGECPGSNGFAGVSGSAPDILRSTLLAAKAADQSITVIISGCLGGWYKINEVYVN